MKIDRDMGIHLPDGTRLSAKVWMPDSALLEPVPAILEYLPYRKSDGTAARDDTMHPVFAEHGYASLRVDRRGCGDSEGLFDDEYSEQEICDGIDIINWIARQPWCSGNVGMQGISWGGFNGVQIAARAPEPLKAVITIGTTVDRYHDDIHYKGGIQLSENIGWAATAMSWLSTPADPRLRKDWREAWLAQLENTPFLGGRWTGHSGRDDYWKHGSICEDCSGIKAAVLSMGGLHDGYRNAMAAMVENIDAPVQGIVGPWGHKYPHISTIGPSIDYHGVALRWFDRWLKGVENGAEDDPAYRAYVMDSVRPDDSLTYRPGAWRVEAQWPSPNITTEVYAFGQGTLGAGAETTIDMTVEPDLACGRASGEFFPFGFTPGELPGDQAGDDALSTCFDSAPLDQEKVLLGAPKVKLRLASDKTRGQIAVRLCDVWPDGQSTLISVGMLDLRNRRGFETKIDMEPGKEYDVYVPLDQVAYRIPVGHRIRVAISGSYWPYCWPEGEDFALTLVSGALEVPECGEDSGEAWEFDPPRPFPARDMTVLRDGSSEKQFEEGEDGRMGLTITADHGRVEDAETGLINESTLSETWEAVRGEPASARAEIVWTRSFGRGNWSVETRVTARMRGEKNAFVIEQQLEAWDGDGMVFERTWEDRIPR